MTQLYEVMKEQLEKAQEALLVMAISGSNIGSKSIYTDQGELVYGPAIEGFEPSQVGPNQLFTLGDTEYFVQAIEKDPSVLVLGAGHVSRAITDLLLFIGCHVTVLDDRPEYLVPEFFDERVQRICLPMDNFKETLSLSQYNGFIIVTRAHEYDNICLSQLRQELPTYMGVMGSQKRIQFAFDVLRQEGWTEEELAQLHAPIGLAIGAQTPEEIALSIVSEYLAVTRGKEGGFLCRNRKERNQSNEKRIC